jgi:hypothetical protein
LLILLSSMEYMVRSVSVCFTFPFCGASKYIFMRLYNNIQSIGCDREGEKEWDPSRGV